MGSVWDGLWLGVGIEGVWFLGFVGKWIGGGLGMEGKLSGEQVLGFGKTLGFFLGLGPGE